MPVTSASPLERRRSARGEPPARFAINLVRANRPVAVNGVNVSRSGMCLRVQETLEVRSLVRLQLTPARGEPGPSERPPLGRPLECTGRVIWVVQRLDLRETPPFLYDVGIEFVDLPAPLRQLMAQDTAAPEAGPPRGRPIAPAMIRRREYHPRIDRTAGHALPWHLVVSVDGVPCFSSRFPSSKAALAGWDQFKRRQARRRPAGKG